MKSFHIDSQLDYEVLQQTLFVFNLAVANRSEQHIRA